MKKSAKKSAKTKAPKHTIDTLDDVAALFVQLESTDVKEIAQLRDGLEAIATQPSIPTDAQTLLRNAIDLLDTIVLKAVPDPDAAMAEAGRMIERALCVDDRLDAAAQALLAEFEEDEKQAEKASPPGMSEPVNFELPPEADLDLMADFITESRELIEGAEAALLTLETDPDDMEAVNTVFRAFHTTKGTSAFLGLAWIADFAHGAEELMSRVRDKEIRYTGGYADLALRSIDIIKLLIEGLQDLLGGQPLLRPDAYDELMGALTNPEVADNTETETPPVRLGDLLVSEGKADREEMEMAATDQGDQPIGVAIVRSQAATVTDVAQALRTQQKISGADRSADSSVRVRTERLDKLIEVVGELVIAHSMVSQDHAVTGGGSPQLLRKVAHTSKIVRELQDLSMSMRMVPLKSTFQKMARLVRDVARKAQKRVNFVTEGEDTEIDRNMVDVINDPLVHMIRNAIDHGIELSEVREQKGKLPAGTVWLRAYHAGGKVVVDIQDDGKGLDREGIIRKAMMNGLIETEYGLSDSEVFNLVFEPGFSTNEEVTDLSGRGVGMDVVKRGIESLGGNVEITSEPGQGCTFSMQLPLTLAIMDGMLVKVGTERYIIPTINIHVSFRPEADMLSSVTGTGELVMVRKELMPIFRLHRLFGINGAVSDLTEGLLVVVSDGERRCALLVDALLGQQQVVTKSLGEGIGKIPGVSGGAILGDGHVGLILDPPGVVALARQALAA